jgi:hypothetical protein
VIGHGLTVDSDVYVIYINVDESKSGVIVEYYGIPKKGNAEQSKF